MLATHVLAHRRRYPERNRARRAVSYAVLVGKLPRPTDLACSDCGGKAKEYDHYRGYAVENKLTVQAVCKPCHTVRTWNK